MEKDAKARCALGSAPRASPTTLQLRCLAQPFPEPVPNLFWRRTNQARYLATLQPVEAAALLSRNSLLSSPACTTRGDSDVDYHFSIMVEDHEDQGHTGSSGEDRNAVGSAS